MYDLNKKGNVKHSLFYCTLPWKNLFEKILYPRPICDRYRNMCFLTERIRLNGLGRDNLLRYCALLSGCTDNKRKNHDT